MWCVGAVHPGWVVGAVHHGCSLSTGTLLACGHSTPLVGKFHSPSHISKVQVYFSKIPEKYV